MDSYSQLLNNVPAEAWVALLGVVFGSLLTTLGVWLTNRSNRAQLRQQLEHDERLQRQRLTRERLEELYVLVCHWLNAMSANYMHLSLVMKGHTDYNAYLDSVTKLGTTDRGDYSRLEMIIGIYGGQVQALYEVALKEREKVNTIITEHKAAYRRGEPGQQFLKQFADAQLEFAAVCDALKVAIANAAKNA